jgi:hypothetical protein
MAESFTPDTGQRQYVPAERGAFYTVLMDGWKDPTFMQKVLGVFVFLLILAALIAPFSQPLRQHLGFYFYVHIGLIAVVLYLFFFKLLPPPHYATERMRRGFMKDLQKEEFQRAGFDFSIVSATTLDADRDTLDITVNRDWLTQPYEKRLSDAHNLWWLWAFIYSPYNGWDKALIRLVDDEGIEVGGSRPDTGSFIWVREG